jgi:hypothetical protein
MMPQTGSRNHYSRTSWRNIDWQAKAVDSDCPHGRKQRRFLAAAFLAIR